MKIWHELGDDFDFNLPRRTAVLVKPEIEGLGYLYPQEFSHHGFYLEDIKKTGYEELSDFGISIYPYLYPSIYSTDELSKISFIYEEQKAYPSYLYQRLSFANIGVEMASHLVSNNQGSVLWNLRCTGKTLIGLDKVFYLLIKGKEISLIDDRVIIQTENSQYEITGNHELLATYSSIDDIEEDLIATQGQSSHRVEEPRYVLLGKKLNLAYDQEQDWQVYIQSVPQEKRDLETMLEENMDDWNHWYDQLDHPEFQTAEERKFYYKCWSTIRINTYQHAEFGRSVLECLPVYKGFWFWALPALEHISHQHPDFEDHDFFKRVVDLFMENQREDGYLPHAIYIDEEIPGQRWMDQGIIQSPNISWAIWRYYQATGDKDSLHRWYAGLVNFYQYMNQSRDPKGLHLWVAQTSYDTGIDTAPVFDDCTYGEEKYVYPAIFGAERLQFERVLGQIVEELGLTGEPNWQEEQEKTQEAIDDYLWDEKKGWYGVLKEDGRLDTRVGMDGVFIFSFGLVDDERAQQAKPNFEKLIGHYGIRTFAPDEEGFQSDIYWRGPTWPTACSYVMGAIQRYYDAELLEQAWQATCRFALHLPNIWECFDADTGQVARGDGGIFSTPGMSTNVGAGELLRGYSIYQGKNLY